MAVKRGVRCGDLRFQHEIRSSQSFLNSTCPAKKKCRPLKLFHALSSFEYLNHVEKHTHMEMKNKLRREH